MNTAIKLATYHDAAKLGAINTVIQSHILLVRIERLIKMEQGK